MMDIGVVEIHLENPIVSLHGDGEVIGRQKGDQQVAPTVLFLRRELNLAGILP
jgi:hypothetical protein